MKKTIVDASPLIFIAKAGMIDVLKKVYRAVYITDLINNEIEKPIKMGFKAPEVEKIKSSHILRIEKLTAKEIVKAEKIAQEKNIGKGESEAAILFLKGGFENVIVADIKAQKKLKELNVSTLDLVDFGFIAAKRGIMNPRKFALNLWEKAHYRSERIRNILGK